jgi:hypothetical protein
MITLSDLPCFITIEDREGEAMIKDVVVWSNKQGSTVAP